MAERSEKIMTAFRKLVRERAAQWQKCSVSGTRFMVSYGRGDTDWVNLKSFIPSSGVIEARNIEAEKEGALYYAVDDRFEHELKEDEITMTEGSDLGFTRFETGAVMGNAKNRAGEESFFTTKKSTEVSMAPDTFLEKSKPERNHGYDVIGCPPIFAILENNPSPKHKGQKIAFWTPISRPLGIFFLFARTKGNDVFFTGGKGAKPKTMEQILELLDCSHYVELTDAFNLMTYGTSKMNPSRESEWTLAMIESLGF